MGSDKLNSTEVVKQWLAAINSHDVNALTTLMAADHVFADSLGNRVLGAKSMEAGWRGYFAMCPDYWIRADHVMSDDDLEGRDPRWKSCGVAGVCG